MKIKKIKQLLMVMFIVHNNSFAFDDFEKGFNAVKIAEAQIEEMQTEVKGLKALNFFELSSITKKNFTVLNWYEDTNISVEMHKGCQLSMFIMPNGLVKPNFIRNENQLKEFKDSDLKLYNKLVLLHEVSHCEYALINKFYIESNSSEKQTKLNKLFDVSKNHNDNLVINDLARLQMESFADTLAIMMLIKINGDNKQTRDVIDLFLRGRHISYLEWKERKIPNTVYAYDTTGNIEKVLKHKEHIINMPAENLKILAMKWSSEHLLETVKQKSPNFRKQIPYNLDTALDIEKFNQIYFE